MTIDPLTRKCLECLRALIRQHCPCAADDARLLSNLVALLEEEVAQATRRERKLMLDQLRRPCPQ